MDSCAFLLALCGTLHRATCNICFALLSHLVYSSARQVAVEIPRSNKKGTIRIIGFEQEVINYKRIKEGNITSNDIFLGIPYAVAKVRFAPSKLVSPDELKSPFNANRWSPGCMAKFGVFTIETARFSEDCLKLNIFRRHSADKKLKPVIMVIHGGGYMAGDAHEKDWHGDHLAYIGDVVVVSFNYRLGIFGFLDLGIPEAPGNQGHRDQVLAMKWVKQNIRHFGGDPKRVTLFGVSAGSFSISTHLMTDHAKGLFHAAILDAGVLSNYNGETKDTQWPRVQHAAKLLKCKNTKTKKEILKCLTAAKAQKLVEIQQTKGVMVSQTYVFRPTYKSDWIHESTDCIINKSKFKVKVPIIIGDTSREGTFLMTDSVGGLRPMLVNGRQTYEWSQHILSNHRAKDLAVGDRNVINKYYQLNYETIYLPKRMEHYRNASAMYIGDGIFVCPVMNFVDHYARLVKDTYFFFWERIRDGEVYAGERYEGAYHGLMFYTCIGSQLKAGSTKVPNTDVEYIRKSIKMIADFAANPKKPPAFGKVKLHPYSKGSVNNFKAAGLKILKTHPRKELCNKIWQKVKNCKL